MNNLILMIHGHPGAGKSWLGKWLRDNHGFAILDLDHEYVDYFRNHRKELYFDWMKLLIADHYNNLVGRRDWLRRTTGVDVYAEWQTFLASLITRTSSNNPRVAVVGYVLHDCMGDLQRSLSSVARTSTVHVENRDGTRTYKLPGYVATTPEDLIKHL